MGVKSIATSSIKTGVKSCDFWDQSTPRISGTALVVGGGGGGGRLGAGGGAGGVLDFVPVAFLGGLAYNITIGAAGAAGVSGAEGGGKGGTTTLAAWPNHLIAYGGGGGNQYGSLLQAASNGASGGGFGTMQSLPVGSANITSQGNTGGKAYNDGTYIIGGGGGGSTAAGGSATGAAGSPGAGGQGTSINATIQALTPFSGMTRVGSGAGSCYYNVGGSSGSGSAGGTGAGSGTGSSGGVGGTATSFGSAGGGSGGGSGNVSNGGAGKAGVVVIKYADTYPAAASTTGSPNITTTGGFRYYTFTGDGSITF